MRITASEIIGVEIITPLLGAFRAKHPQIQIEPTLTSRSDDLIHREADIAVRLFRPTQTALVARRLGRLAYSQFAHPDYIAAHGALRTSRELAVHALICFDSEALVARARGMSLARDALTFRCDSYAAQHAARKAGLGIVAGVPASIAVTAARITDPTTATPGFEPDAQTSATTGRPPPGFTVFGILGVAGLRVARRRKNAR